MTRAMLDNYAVGCTTLDLPDFWFEPSLDGRLVVPLGAKASAALELERAVGYVEQLLLHRHRSGFEHFMDGWRNGPQLDDSVTELICMQFLMACAVHRDISFGPYVDGSGAGKRADLLWETAFGPFLVEAKSTSVMTGDASDACARLVEEATAVCDT